MPEELLTNDVLPAGLIELDCPIAPEPGPLLHLQQLRRLSLGGDMPAAGLQLLGSTLTALESVNFKYWSDNAALAAAGWSSLPVKSLHVTIHMTNTFDLPTLRYFAGLTQLTQLCFCVYEDVPWTRSDVAAVVAGLKQLEAFELSGRGMHEPADVPRAEHVLDIAQAVAGLPRLQRLQLAHNEFGREAAMVLSGMSQLTCLQLMGCALNSYDVNVLAVKLAALQALEASYTPDVGDCVLPVIAHNLKHLSSLELMHTGVTELGLQWLAEMHHLRKVGVCPRLAASVALADRDLLIEADACLVCLHHSS
jgi:hypothetical protein